MKQLEDTELEKEAAAAKNGESVDLEKYNSMRDKLISQGEAQE